MIKQRKRVTTKEILRASNWVRENIHQLSDKKMTKQKWCDTLSDGVGVLLTIPTAIDILEENGVTTSRRESSDAALDTRVSTLEQQVIGLLREIQSLQKSKSSLVDDDRSLFPKVFKCAKQESEVINGLSRS